MRIEQFKYCVSIDLETTGIDPQRNGMISLGACTIFEDFLYVENAPREGCEISQQALEVNGEDENLLLERGKNGFPSELDALLEVFDFCKKHNSWVIIGKNPKFDYSFLYEIWKNEKDKNEGNKVFDKFPFSYRVIDYSSLALPLFLLKGYEIPKEGVSSSQIQELLDIPEEPKPHNALTGAQYNIVALNKLIKLYNEIVLK